MAFAGGGQMRQGLACWRGKACGCDPGLESMAWHVVPGNALLRPCPAGARPPVDCGVDRRCALGLCCHDPGIPPLLAVRRKRLSGISAASDMASRYLSIARQDCLICFSSQMPAGLASPSHFFLCCMKHPIDLVRKRCIVEPSADSHTAWRLQFPSCRRGCACQMWRIVLRCNGQSLHCRPLTAESSRISLQMQAQALLRRKTASATWLLRNEQGERASPRRQGGNIP